MSDKLEKSIARAEAAEKRAETMQRAVLAHLGELAGLVGLDTARLDLEADWSPLRDRVVEVVQRVAELEAQAKRAQIELAVARAERERYGNRVTLELGAVEAERNALKARVAKLERVIAYYQDGDQYHAAQLERELGIEDLSSELELREADAAIGREAP